MIPPSQTINDDDASIENTNSSDLDQSKSDRALRKDWLLVAAQTFLFSFGFSIYAGVFQNFLRDVMHAGPLRLGELESLREIPGLLAAITAGTVVALAESRVAGLGLLITGVGIGLTGFTTGFPQLIAITVFWSVGFHLYVTVGAALTLTLAKGQRWGTSPRANERYSRLGYSRLARCGLGTFKVAASPSW